MIDHKRKLIFIHIPRTGGTSIETALVDKDWWCIDSATKHITANESKLHYGKEIWKSYKTFSIIRNPWDRVISMWATKWYHKDIPKTNNNIKNFILQLKPYPHEHGLQCSDYINEELDYIIRFENLQEEFTNMMKKLNLNIINLPHVSKMKRDTNYRKYYDEETKEIVTRMFKDDIERFGYKF